MNLLDDEAVLTADRKATSKNLQTASTSFVLLLLSSILLMIFLNSFAPGHSHGKVLSWFFIIVFVAVKLFAAVFAILTLRNTFKIVRRSKDFRNYFAIAISLLVLIAIGNDLLNRI